MKTSHVKVKDIGPDGYTVDGETERVYADAIRTLPASGKRVSGTDSVFVSTYRWKKVSERPWDRYRIRQNGALWRMPTTRIIFKVKGRHRALPLFGFIAVGRLPDAPWKNRRKLGGARWRWFRMQEGARPWKGRAPMLTQHPAKRADRSAYVWHGRRKCARGTFLAIGGHVFVAVGSTWLKPGTQVHLYTGPCHTCGTYAPCECHDIIPF